MNNSRGIIYVEFGPNKRLPDTLKHGNMRSAMILFNICNLANGFSDNFKSSSHFFTKEQADLTIVRHL
jgi:hypothetical protein